MDKWDKSLREDRHRHRRENPSFSSTLLDAIYRSIDEGRGEREEELIYYREKSMRKKQQQQQSNGLKEEEEEMASLRRACMIEKWMEKKVSEKVVVGHRNSMADFDRKSRKDCALMLQNSSSSSSESSSGGGFSSSESESVYATKSRSSCYSMQRPKPIRTSVSEKPQTDKFGGGGGYGERSYSGSTQKPKHENGFVKTKSKAMKIYGDLKKVKQPISPGGRLASFLNSLFTNAKKTKVSSSVGGRSYEDTTSERKSKSATTSTCSSASSFSRSCLSKTPSSRGKFSNGGSGGGVKRSVRFFPVSVIVDEDCRPCGHKSLHEDDQPGVMKMSQEIKCYVMGGNYRVEEVAKDLLKNYQKEKEDLHMRDVDQDSDVDDDDDDDAGSCSSSDLFELDNLSAIGIERYREELPVYETTHFDTNRAIAKGLIM